LKLSIVGRCDEGRRLLPAFAPEVDPIVIVLLNDENGIGENIVIVSGTAIVKSVE
jgi:hypothetical protein